MARKLATATRAGSTETNGSAPMSNEAVPSSGALEIRPVAMTGTTDANNPVPVIDEEKAPEVDGSPESGIAMDRHQVTPDPPQVASKPIPGYPQGLDMQAIEVKPDTVAE